MGSLAGIFFALSLQFAYRTEALGLPYLISGASEKNGKFAAIFNHNFQVDHLWETMKEQVSERPCQLFGCKGLGSCSMRNELDIWVMGTPCPPFSEQNVSRKKPGAVEGHALYSVTFTDALAAICSGHKAYLLEQVPGFNKPYDSDSSETPLDRPLGMVCCSVQATKRGRRSRNNSFP